MRPLILLVPSFAAARELPRRLASAGRPLAGVYAFEVRELARAVAEPALLGRGLVAWNRGHASLLAARLLDGPHGLRVDDRLPRAPVALALARTLVALRTGGVDPDLLDSVAARAGTAEDRDRLRALAGLHRAYVAEVESRFADGATVLAAAARHVADAKWLTAAEVLVVDDLELDPAERAFVSALARTVQVRRLALTEAPAPLAASGFASWAAGQNLASVPWTDTLLAPVAPPPAPPGLARLRAALFEPPAGTACTDDSVELMTAPGEAAEVRSIVRRLLREAGRGIAFEEMGVVLPRPDTYAPLFTDLLSRLGIPFRLHPSLPLANGRATRALLLMLRCRGLGRPEVMEFLTFAPVPFAELLGDETPVDLAAWDQASRDAGIVSDLARWIVGLRAYAETERREAGEDEWRRARANERATLAESLLRLVELLSSTLESLEGFASWPEWSQRLQAACDQWIGPEDDRDALADVIADLAGLSSFGGRAGWRDVERVLATRLAWERLPMPPRTSGAIHLGALDAIAGLPFRVLAIPGLVEGGYPGPLRLDPFLLDHEREALAAPPPRRTAGQLALFGDGQESTAPSGPHPLPTAQDRLLEARRLFHRAIRQATDRLILSYPRADSRSGRERVPSLFFVSAASALAGRPLGAPELAALTGEDDRDALPLEDALDAGERDRLRVRRGGTEAVLAVAAGSPSFKGAHLAAHERWSRFLTPHDGLVDGLPGALARRLDPLTSSQPVSASSLARFATCGFQYLLASVLRLKAPVEPEERLGLNALEKGTLFHEVAETFLRGERDAGRLPVADDDETRTRLLDLARTHVDRLVAGTPPRHRMVWDMHWRAFCDLLLRFLAREAANPALGRPAHFEVAFGLGAQGTNERARPPAARGGPGRRPRAARVRQDRPHRRARGRVAGAARLQDGTRPSRRQPDLQGGPSAPDPVLRAGGAADLPGAARRARVPRLRGRRAAGRVRPGRVHRRVFPRAAAHAHVRHRGGPLRAGAHRLPLLRLPGRVRAAAAAGAAAAVQAGRSAPARVPEAAGVAMSWLPADQRDRERARRSRGETLVLEAGAGTGKTTLLVDRIESLILDGDARVTEIAAVTFTENAAATMKLRLRERLERARASADLPADARARATVALDTLERAQVSTIHALCAAILQERPLECGVVPGFRIADEAQAEALFAEAWDEWLSERLDASDPVLAEAVRAEIPLMGVAGFGESSSLRGLARTLLWQRDLRPLTSRSRAGSGPVARRAGGAGVRARALREARGARRRPGATRCSAWRSSRSPAASWPATRWSSACCASRSFARTSDGAGTGGRPRR